MVVLTTWLYYGLLNPALISLKFSEKVISGDSEEQW